MRTLIIMLLVGNLVAGIALVLGVGAKPPAPSPVVDEPPAVAGNLTLLDDVADPPRLRRDAAPLAVMPGAPVPVEAPPKTSQQTDQETRDDRLVESAPSHRSVAQAAVSAAVVERARPSEACVVLGPFPDGARAEAALAPHLRELGIGAPELIDAARFHELLLPLPEPPASPGAVPAELAARLAEAGFASPEIDTRDGQVVLLLETRRRPERAADRLRALHAAGHGAARVLATGSGAWLRLRLAPPVRASLAAIAARAGVGLLRCPPERE